MSGCPPLGVAKVKWWWRRNKHNSHNGGLKKSGGHKKNATPVQPLEVKELPLPFFLLSYALANQGIRHRIKVGSLHWQNNITARLWNEKKIFINSQQIQNPRNITNDINQMLWRSCKMYIATDTLSISVKPNPFSIRVVFSLIRIDKQRSRWKFLHGFPDHNTL